MNELVRNDISTAFLQPEKCCGQMVNRKFLEEQKVISMALETVSGRMDEIRTSQKPVRE